MTYAQKDYDQIQGNNGINTIAEIGSLLTAFANLLGRFGTEVDPATLNSAFVEDGVYLYKTDEVRDRLAVSSISAYDSTIGISGFGPGIPQTHNAIVRLDYHSAVTGTDVSTYALVTDNVAGLIIDSLDGIEKHWSVYGEPIEWYSYHQFEAVTIAPLRAPAAPEKPEMYTVNHGLRGYLELTDAEASINSTINVEPGEYYLIEIRDSLVNISSVEGHAGAWISVAENGTEIEQASVADNDGDSGDKIPVRVVPPEDWQSTYDSNLGVLEMETVNDSVVHDYAGEQPDREVKAEEVVPVAGHFLKDGITYARTRASVEHGHWYGIPVTNLRNIGEDGDEIDRQLDGWLGSSNEDLRDELSELSTKEKAIKVAATTEGKLAKAKSKLFSFGKK